RAVCPYAAFIRVRCRSYASSGRGNYAEDRLPGRPMLLECATSESPGLDSDARVKAFEETIANLESELRDGVDEEKEYSEPGHGDAQDGSEEDVRGLSGSDNEYMDMAMSYSTSGLRKSSVSGGRKNPGDRSRSGRRVGKNGVPVDFLDEASNLDDLG